MKTKGKQMLKLDKKHRSRPKLIERNNGIVSCAWATCGRVSIRHYSKAEWRRLEKILRSAGKPLGSVTFAGSMREFARGATSQLQLAGLFSAGVAAPVKFGRLNGIQLSTRRALSVSKAIGK